MIQTAVTKRVTTINEAEQQFNLVRTADADFFTEWRNNLPELTDTEKAVLDRIKARYRYELYNVLMILKGLGNNIENIDTS